MRDHWSNYVKISIDGRRYLLRYLTPTYRKAVGAGTTEKLFRLVARQTLFSRPNVSLARGLATRDKAILWQER